MSNILINLLTDFIETEAIQSDVPVAQLTPMSYAVIADRDARRETAERFLSRVSGSEKEQLEVFDAASRVARRFEKVVGDNPIPAAFYLHDSVTYANA